MRERRPEDVFRHGPAAVAIVRPEADCIMQAEPGVTPAEEFADHRLVSPSLPEEQAEDAVPEEVLQGIQIDLRKRHEPAGRRE